MSATTTMQPAQGAGAAGAAQDEKPVLECHHLSRNFLIGKRLFHPGKVLRAVDDVSISLRRGEVLAIVGESGSGKTTLGRMLLGMLPPSAGEIRINGETVAGIPRMELARRIQPVFQDPYSSLNPRKTVGQLIALPLDVQGRGTVDERRRAVDDMMERVGLPRRLVHNYPSQLSGGQRQRVAIARALVLQPEIVVLDEPTSALDVSVQAQILNLLEDLRSQLTLTYIFISHDLAVVEHLADRIAVMYLGRVVEHGPAESVLRAPRHPYSRALLQSVLTPDPSLGLPEVALVRGFQNPLNLPAGCPFNPRCTEAMDRCLTLAPAVTGDAQAGVECFLYGDAVRAARDKQAA